MTEHCRTRWAAWFTIAATSLAAGALIGAAIGLEKALQGAGWWR